MVKVAVCDDEPSMREDIFARLSEYKKKEGLDFEIRLFSSGGELLEHGIDYDVLFLDIQMEGPNGMETAGRLRERGFTGLLIFITVLEEYVFDAFYVEACDYLVKPLDDFHFARTMDRIMGKLQKTSGGRIVVEKNGCCEVVPFTEILFCEVMGRKLYLHRTDGTAVDYYGKLAHLEKKLDGRFFKCHRSYLVNLDCVKGFGEGLVRLEKGGRIPLSRLREKDFKQALLSHLKKRQ